MVKWLVKRYLNKLIKQKKFNLMSIETNIELETNSAICDRMKIFYELEYARVKLLQNTLEILDAHDKAGANIVCED